MKFSIVIPAHNEEGSIAKTIRSIEGNVACEHEIIVVNDHSTDKTEDEVQRQALEPRSTLRLVQNQNAAGFANALIAGFAHSSTDYVLPVMADLCDDPCTIDQMAAKIEEGYDIVCGCRYMPGGKKIGGPKLKSFFSRFVGLSLHYLIGIPTRDISNSFKMYKKEILGRFNIESKGFEISLEIPLKAFFLGYKITEIPTVWTDRKEGKSKFKVFRQGPLYLKLFLWAIARRLIQC